MLRSSPNGDVVLRLLDGRSDRNEVVLHAGKPLPPFAVGSGSLWKVTAPHVHGVHVMIAFNGTSLFVCARPGTGASLGGVPLDARWVEARVPSELRFGGARIVIERRAETSLGVPVNMATTRVVDLAAARMNSEIAATRVSAGNEKSDDESTVIAPPREDVHPAMTEAVTRIADVEVPAEAKGPSSEEITTPPAPAMPMPRPPSRPVRIVKKPPTPPRTEMVDVVPPNLLKGISAAPRAERPAASTTKVDDAPCSPARELTNQLLQGLRSSPASPRKRISERALPRSMPPLPSAASLPAETLSPASTEPCSAPETLPGECLAADASSPATAPPAPPAAARPSSPTIAVPLEMKQKPIEEDGPTGNRPRLDSLEACVGAVTESRLAPQVGAGGSGSSPLVNRLRSLQRGWNEASFPKKASMLLVLPALLGTLAMLGATPSAAHAGPREGTTTTTSASAGSAPVGTTERGAAVAPSSTVRTPAMPSASAVPSASSASAPPKPALAPLRDTRTGERRALDAAAAGMDAEAAEQYEALAAAHPENVAFREAARILRARATARRD